MNVEEKFNLIKRGTQEIVTEDELKSLMKKKSAPTVYWGTAPTGRVHIGYLIPFVKFRDFIEAGFNLKILLADLHAHLDDQKTPWELLDSRTKYYKEVIKGALKSVGIPLSKVEFVKGSDFQLNEKYSMTMLRLASLVTLNRSRRAASEVVRFKEDPKLGGFIYPLMQVLDVEFLKADVAFGGIDQRGIYMLGREVVEELNFNKYVSVFNPMLPGLTGQKMSASDPSSKIDLLDSEEDVKKKVQKAYCPAQDMKDNGVMTFIEHVIFPLRNEFNIKRPEKFGGNVDYSSYSDLERDYLSGKIHPLDLKNSVAREINFILEPVRKHFANKQNLIKKAYPNE